MAIIDLKAHYPFLQGGSVSPFVLEHIQDGDIPWKRPAVLIIPGGAYAFVSAREGEPIAARFLAKGFQCFILKYRCAPEGAHYPEMLLEAGCAIDYIKRHADEYHVNPGEVFALGFSAGGHLAANLACSYGDLSAFGLDVDCHLKGVGLVYPVINHHLGYDETHRFLLNHLQGEAFEEKANELDLDGLVKENHAPTFLAVTASDDYVPVQNSLVYGKALADHHVPFAMRVYPFGPHGGASGDKEISPCPHFPQERLGFDSWSEECADFFRHYCIEPF